MDAQLNFFSKFNLTKIAILALKTLILTIVAAAITGQAQTLSSSTDGATPSGLQPGSPAGSYALNDFENVNLFNGNLNFNLSLLKLGGRGGLQIPLLLPFDSVHWKVDKDQWSCAREGAPACPGTTNGTGSCYRIIVNQSCENAGTFYSTDPEGNFEEFKQSYGFGYLIARHSGHGAMNSSTYSQTLTRLTFNTPGGTQYEMRDQLTNGEPKNYTAPGVGFNRGRIFVTSNGEAATFISDTDIMDRGLQGSTSVPEYPSGVLWTSDGTRYQIEGGKATRVRDRNGNEVKFAFSGNQVTSVTDSLNRTVTIGYTATADTITYSGANGVARTVLVRRTPMSNALRAGSGYQIQHFNQLFTVAQGINANSANDYNPTVVSEVVLPDSRTYKLLYNPYGELARVEMPTGGAVEYEYTAGADSIPDPGSPQIYRRITERRVYKNGGTGGSYDSRQIFTPVYGGDSNLLTMTVTVEQRNSNGDLLTKDRHYFNGNPLNAIKGFADRMYFYTGWIEGKEYKTETLDTAGNVLKTTENFYQNKAPVSWWTASQTGFYTPANDPRLIRTETTLNETNQKTKTEYTYDDFNNPTEVKEYDYGTNGAFGALKRKTVTSYVDANTVINNSDYVCAICANNQPTIHSRRLPKQTSVYDASNNISALSTVEYDNYGTDARHEGLTGRIGITNLCLQRDGSGNCTQNSDTNYLTRGNATQTVSYTDALAQTGAATNSRQYDVAGNVVKTIDAKGYVSTISYNDNFGSPDNEARANFAPSQLNGLNTFAFPTSGTNQMGWIVGYTQYDYFTGQAVNSEDINGIISKTVYNDSLDRPTQAVSAIGTPFEQQATIVYDDANHRVQQTGDLKTLNDNLSKTESFYDGMGRTFESRKYEANGGYIVSQTEYDGLGRPKRVTNPYRPAEITANNPVLWTESFYDSLGRSVKVRTPDGAEVNTSYSGSTVTVTDQAGKQRRSVTNALGQLTRVDEPNDGGQLDMSGSPAQSTGYIYDPLGNLLTVNQGSQTRSFVYDSLSRLKQATNPESGMIAYVYDSNGNLTNKTDARGVQTSYVYDALNRVTNRNYLAPAGLQNYGATPNVAYFYDNLPNAKGKLTKVSSADSTTEYTSFDQMGRVNAHRQTTDGNVYTTGYVYNLSGALIEETYPSGRVVKNTLDADGDLAQVQSKKNAGSGFQNYAGAFTYTAAGAVSSLRLGNGRWESTQFNSRLQPTQIALGNVQNANNLLKLDYTYNTPNAADNNGNVRTQTITTPTVGSNAGFTAVQNYNYDSLNRLKDATETISNSQTWKQTFTYDRYGNRNFDTANGNTTTLVANCQAAVCNPTVSTVNNRFNTGQGYSYDAAGNVTSDPTIASGNRNFVYDAENKQIQVSNSSGVVGQYVYDGDGKRVKKISASETTIFVYDAGGKMVAEYSTATNPTPQTSYLTSDNLGTPRISTDANGAVISRHDYLPFGEEAVTAQRVNRNDYQGDAVRKQFTSYERDDESDLDFAQARYYKSAHGRFTSPDDFLNDTKVFEPDSWNLYAYVRNNPLTNIDPSGEEVDGTDLNDAQRKQLVDDWKKKTGYKNVYFDTKTNKLVVDTAAGFKKGSATARKELLAAATSTSKIFNLKATNGSSSVAFAQNVGTATSTNATTGAKTDTYDVNIDFDDFKQLKGDKAAKNAFSIGIAVIHEFEHGLHERESTGSDYDSPPNGSEGPLERTYINPIRSELGLAQRSAYDGVLRSTGKNAGFVELKFRDTKGKDKILRWKDSVVGGKHK